MAFAAANIDKIGRHICLANKRYQWHYTVRCLIMPHAACNTKTSLNETQTNLCGPCVKMSICSQCTNNADKNTFIVPQWLIQIVWQNTQSVWSEKAQFILLLRYAVMPIIVAKTMQLYIWPIVFNICQFLAFPFCGKASSIRVLIFHDCYWLTKIVGYMVKKNNSKNTQINSE